MAFQLTDIFFSAFNSREREIQPAFAQRELRQLRIGAVIFQHQNMDFLFHPGFPAPIVYQGFPFSIGCEIPLRLKPSRLYFTLIFCLVICPLTFITRTYA